MAFYCKCPSCGHRHRLSEEWLGKEIKCAACADPFTVSAQIASAELPAKPATQPKVPWPRLLQKILRDPSAALEAAIPGAISGVLAGFQGALLAGIVYGQAAGEIVARIMIGFVIGFALGTLLGTLLGAVAKRIRPDFHLEPGIAALVGGAMIGGIVVAIVEKFWWIPLGAGIGGAGADLWLMLANRLEPVTRVPSHVDSEEHFVSHAERMERSQTRRRRSRASRNR